MPTHEIDSGVFVGPFHESLAVVLSPNPKYKTIINVFEQPLVNPLMAINLATANIAIIDHPILSAPETVSKDKLDSLVDRINFSKPCAVCCVAGIERSPLAVAWYLHKTRNISFDDAYRDIQLRHPETQYRGWLIK